ncbi:TetR family transcriptional regulator [Streptomyces umbrinus]|uniref:TetR family transcriptional regulator n=1 Tax=Streptomyces umbrinus TaxID=67370 RepID=UPI00167E13F7|nr:TetR family transcriptional regulator [Streptomyces umbrinus]MCR3726637.1 AcrR family transcriptional regulator [Streptomyces umbrinus]GHH33557.1 TetR family transcriptional regulator [Streptomyces umbrinus]
MGRWMPDAAGRLSRAALELYEERGFEDTTVAEIAERAGLTKRTFFRHFPDKREVLFPLSARIHQVIVDAMAAAPADLSPLAVVLEGYGAAVDMVNTGHAQARRRRAVIVANPELRERELTKFAGTSAAVTEALCERGVAPQAAFLTAAAGAAAWRAARERWVEGPETQDLHALLRESVEELRAAVAAPLAP